MRQEEKNDKALMECYIELYANSTPSADFMELFNNAEINERGQKVIDYNSYEIDEDKFNNIVDSIIKKYKYKSFYKKAFMNTILLGCSPKFKKQN
jgi:hypothetical protein